MNTITKTEIDQIWLGAINGHTDPTVAARWATKQIRDDKRIPNQIIFEGLGFMQSLEYHLDPARQPDGRLHALEVHERWEESYRLFAERPRAWAVKFFGERHAELASSLGEAKAEKVLRRMIDPPELIEADVRAILDSYRRKT